MTSIKLLIAAAGLLLCAIGASAQITLTGAGKAVTAPGCSFTRIDFTTGSLGAASLSRSSANATYKNSGGTLATAGSNVARFNYDANYPAGGTPSLTGPFLLVEPASTNLFIQSNNFTTSWLTGNSPVLTSGVYSSPDGTVDGWSMTIGTGFGNVEQFITLTAVPYTMSAWSLNPGTLAPLAFQINNLQGPDNTQGATFVRYAYTGTPTAGSFVYNALLINTNVAATIGIFGAQLEQSSAVTSYIATTTGTATRAADVATFTQPSNCGHNVYTFDNNTTQTITQAPGTATVPTNLNRPNIKYIDGSS